MKLSYLVKMVRKDKARKEAEIKRASLATLKRGDRLIEQARKLIKQS